MSGVIDGIQSTYSTYIERELRSDHAGETGAVYIYKGIVAVAKLRQDTELIVFAQNHGATETEHLQLIESVLEQKNRSRLLGPWRLAGWLTGALPALFGRGSVYATIAAVETFVEQHYQHQIDHLQKEGGHDALLQLLIRCQADEIDHKNEARLKASASVPLVLRVWCSLVGQGSATAVQLARRF
jgi:ubiquinone biosynthesis monooxygenase Coq7